MSNFFEELKRRKVYRVATSYAVVAFLIMQLVEILFPMFNFPQWTQQFIVIIVLLGFPIAVILSWIFDKTPEGFIKTKPSALAPSTEDVKKIPFLKRKSNWFLVLAVISGVLIGKIGGESKVLESINFEEYMKKSIININNITFFLAIIYTIGHIFIALICTKLLTGATLDLAVIDALVEPIINGFWFFILIKIFKRYKKYHSKELTANA